VCAVARLVADLTGSGEQCPLAAHPSIWVESYLATGMELGMNVDTRDLISITEANSKGVSKLVADAENGRPQVLLRNSRAVAAIVNIDSMDRLQRLEEMEDDMRLLSIALVRAAADSGRRYDLDDVLAEAGIDADSLDDE
jgi:antitoxin (DNA-binding transcriptional repressor) of toxin-antitoxin stability system